jgi:F420-dependent oxidoreductase-like protein
MRRLARRADDNPDWESIWVYDHFHTTPVPSEEATHEAWSLMAAFAAATDRVRLGQMCTCMSYRNPAYLAKVAATIDVISGGRIEMGIGGGWYEHEWRAYGYGFPPAGERLGRLRDGVEIFRQMWTKGVATHAGKYYTVDGAIGQPRPLQGTTKPGSAANGIPMWVAGGGEKVTLRIVASTATTPISTRPPEKFAHKSEVLEGHCKDVGRDFGSSSRSANYQRRHRRDPQKDVEDRLAVDRGLRTARPGSRTRQSASSGSCSVPARPSHTGADRRATPGFEKAGMTYCIANFREVAYDTSAIELFEQTVIRSCGGTP